MGALRIRITSRRYEYLLAIGEDAGQVQAVEYCPAPGAPGRLQRIADPRATRQRVHACPADRTCHVDDDLGGGDAKA